MADNETSCECELAGWCFRHQRKKSERLLKLCQTNQGYYDAWERATAPERVLTVKYNHWGPLHFYAVKHWDDWDTGKAKLWLATWETKIPRGCGCSANWRQEMQRLPADMSCARGFFEWAWKIHDSVNERLNKGYRPTIEETYLIWFEKEPNSISITS